VYGYLMDCGLHPWIMYWLLIDVYDIERWILVVMT